MAGRTICGGCLAVGRSGGAEGLAAALDGARTGLDAPTGRAGAGPGSRTAEVLIALVALTTGGWLAPVLVAGSYTGFAAFVALARARGGVLSSCGCFGKADTPPTRTHLAVTVGAAAIAFAVALDPIGPLRGVLAGAPMSGLPFLGLTAVCVWFAYLALAVLPRAGGRAVAVAAGARRT